MAYIINNTRGQIVAVIEDGTIDSTTTTLDLVGRGVTDYGTSENENLIRLLENSADSSAPTTPITGQLWFNTSDNQLYVRTLSDTWQTFATEDYVQAQKNDPVFTGTPEAPTVASSNNSNIIATTAFVQAQKASPSFTGVPTTPTAPYGNNTTQIASTAFVQNAITGLNLENYAPIANPTFTGTVAGPTPETTANDTRYATTAFVQAQKASPVFTGVPKAPTAGASTANTQIATTEFVSTAVGAIDLSPYATSANAALTGIPTAPTAASSTNTTQIATTEFVTSAIGSLSGDVGTIYAPITSPNLVGTPTAPTPIPGTTSTQIATTAFVQNAVLSADFGDVTLGGAQTFTGIKTFRPGLKVGDSVSPGTGAVEFYTNAGTYDSELYYNNGIDGFQLILHGNVLFTADTGSFQHATQVRVPSIRFADGSVQTTAGSGGSDYTLPTASTSTLGGVKVDGTTITISSGVISSTATSYTLPVANSYTLGGIKVGSGLSINSSGVLSATGGGGGGGGPAGSNTQIQFNNEGSFGATSKLKYTEDATSELVTIGSSRFGTVDTGSLEVAYVVGETYAGLTIGSGGGVKAVVLDSISFRPTEDNNLDLGSASTGWQDLYLEENLVWAGKYISHPRPEYQPLFLRGDGVWAFPPGGSGSSGVSKIIAGSNITISPSSGTGTVTINASGGGSGSPGGTNRNVQYNGSGSFAGNNNFTYASGTRGTNYLYDYIELGEEDARYGTDTNGYDQWATVKGRTEVRIGFGSGSSLTKYLKMKANSGGAEVVPNADNTISLGNSTNGYKNFYLSNEFSWGNATIPRPPMNTGVFLRGDGTWASGAGGGGGGSPAGPQGAVQINSSGTFSGSEELKYVSSGSGNGLLTVGKARVGTYIDGSNNTVAYLVGDTGGYAGLTVGTGEAVVLSANEFRPTQPDNLDLGSSAYPWEQIYFDKELVWNGKSIAAPNPSWTNLFLRGDGTWQPVSGGGYTLPTASTTTLGGVKVDGTTVTINGSGVISANRASSTNYKIIYGSETVYSWTDITGSWSNSANYFDVFPPTGYTMSDLAGGMVSINEIYFDGKVDQNDAIRCQGQILSDRVRVFVQNTEQRAAPRANYMLMFNN